MNIEETYDLKRLVRELEVAFLIEAVDFEDKDIAGIIKASKMRISQQYQLDVQSYKVNDEALALGQYRNALTIYIDNIANIHAKLCGYLHIVRYCTQSQINLANVNFFGYTEESLRATLRAMQRKDLQPKAEEAIEALKVRLNSVSLCWEKRVCVLLIVAYELGFPEVTAALAEILYIGLVK